MAQARVTKGNPAYAIVIGVLAGALLFGAGRQLKDDLSGGPWRPDPTLTLVRSASPPCTRYWFVVTSCDFEYIDGSTKGRLSYFVMGRFARDGDGALLVRSQRRPELVTLAHALEMNTWRTVSFVIWEALCLAMAGAGIAGLLGPGAMLRSKPRGPEGDAHGPESIDPQHAEAGGALALQATVPPSASFGAAAVRAASQFNESPEQLAARLTTQNRRPGARATFGLRRG